jgi:NAD-dependent SIR2 family protein deacetylase
MLILSEEIRKIKRNILRTLFFSSGISTESGIPDYRSEGVGLYATSRYGNLCFFLFLAHGRIKKKSCSHLIRIDSASLYCGSEFYL